MDHQRARVIPPPRTGSTAYDLQKPLPPQAEEDQVELVIALVGAMPVSYTHLTLPTNLRV